MAPCRCMMVSGNLLQPQPTAFQPGWQSKAACMRLEAWTGYRTPFRGSATAAMESLQSYWRRYIRFVKHSRQGNAQQGVIKFQLLLKPVCAAANECHKLQCLCTHQDHSCLKACIKRAVMHIMGSARLFFDKPSASELYWPWQLIC